MLSERRMDAVPADGRGTWDEVLDQIGIYDFYHLAAFHQLAEIRGEGKPVMAVFREGGWMVAFPLLVRPIDLPWSDEGQFDATSVVGMAGPLAPAGLPDEIRADWLADLQDFLTQHHIVSVYARLNYALGQMSLLAGLGSVSKRHTEVVIDVTTPPEEQLARYEHGHREQIARLRRMGFACRVGGLEDLDEFVVLYENTMDRLGDQATSRLDQPYFDYLMRHMPEHIHLMSCKQDSETVMMGMLSACNGIVHGLYMGMDPDYRRLSPFKLVIDESRRWACAKGARLLLLGSGNCRPDDTLLKFKLGFGGEERVYCTWSHVVDPVAYRDLCSSACRLTETEPDDSYFPLYRHPALTPVVTTDDSLLVGMGYGESTPV